MSRKTHERQIGTTNQDSKPKSEMRVLRLRVFLASPGDVADERNLARQVLDQMRYDVLSRVKLDFEVVAWDQAGAGVPMLATMTPQAAISAGLPKPSECDIVVAIFWARMGTPLPPGEFTKADGTPYLSGSEWEYLDALHAAEHSGKPTLLVYRRTEPCLLDQDDPSYVEKREQYVRLKGFFATFRNPDGSIKRGWNPYAHPHAFRQQLEEHLKSVIAARLENVDVPCQSSPPGAALTPSPPLWEGSPFPGLRAFTPADAPIFFGRDGESDELVRRLSDFRTRFIAVVGASGSGKSSLVAAGLLPRLRANAIEGSKDWLLPDMIDTVPEAGARKQWAGLRFTPGETGDNPFQALAVKLAPLLSGDSVTPRKIAEHLEASPAAIKAYAEDALRDKPAWAELLAFIDQFEELFSLVAESHRAKFVELLAAVTETSRLRTIVTMRADFYPNCLESPKLAELLREVTVPLAAPRVAALYEMITRPAARAGLNFEPGLPDLMLEKASANPGTLALVAFALHELYEAKTPGGTLTQVAYRLFGGVEGAIGQRAEMTFESLAPATHSVLGSVLRHLAEVNEQGVATRRRAKLAEVASSREAGDLVAAFVDARLFVTDRASDGTTTVEVAHEALFGNWARFKDWYARSAGDLTLRRQAEREAESWHAAGRRLDLRWNWERQQPVLEALRKLTRGSDLLESDLDFDSAGIRTWRMLEGVLSEPLRSFLRPEPLELLGEIVSDGTPHHRREEIGVRLSQMGDPRRGVGLNADGLPDILWIDIPGGELTMQREDATRFTVQPFRVAKYLVTWKQYSAFLEAEDGYRDVRWWHGGLHHGEMPGEKQWSFPNYPAVNVSWHDAMAFCRWISSKLGRAGPGTIRLPKEWEWQWAAQSGAKKREFPWQGEWNPMRANSVESGVGRTVAVGMYPLGAPSPRTVLDLAGNVAEWCLNEYDAPHNTEIGGGVHARALRGGSWYRKSRYCGAGYRDDQHADQRRNYIGFRVCCEIPNLVSVRRDTQHSTSGKSAPRASVRGPKSAHGQRET